MASPATDRRRQSTIRAPAVPPAAYAHACIHDVFATTGKLHVKRIAIAALLACTWSSGLALADATRDERIQQLIAAQGLQLSIDQQLTAMASELQSAGRQMVQQRLAIEGQTLPPELEAVFARFTERAVRLFSAEEVLAVFAEALNASDLTDAELETMVAYYSSPVGQRDVVAQRQASVAMAVWIAQESNTRYQAVLQQLIAELEQLEPSPTAAP
jgi:hypothetical protein